MFQLEAISAQRLYRVIAEKIAARIRAGEFGAGDRLPAERELAEMLQVSRASVREALIALELSGYVEVRMGSGVYVLGRSDRAESRPQSSHEQNHAAATKGSTAGGSAAGLVPVLKRTRASTAPNEARMATDISPFELLETRLLIEPESAACAAQRADDAGRERIRQAHQSMAATQSHTQADRMFHASIAAACGNGALEALVQQVWDLSLSNPIYARLDQHFIDHKVWDVVEVEHERVAHAILERDPIRARHAMTHHLLAIMARLREDFGDDLVAQRVGQAS